MDGLQSLLLIGILIVLVVLLRRSTYTSRLISRNIEIQFEPAVTWWWRQDSAQAKVVKRDIGEITLKLDVTAPPGRAITLAFATFDLNKRDRRRGILAAIVDQEGENPAAKDPLRSWNDGHVSIWQHLPGGAQASILLTVRFSNLDGILPWFWFSRGLFQIYYLYDGSHAKVLQPNRGVESERIPMLGKGGRYLYFGDLQMIPGQDVSAGISQHDQDAHLEWFHPDQNWPQQSEVLKNSWSEHYSNWLEHRSETSSSSA
jgi:hypothetical protein